MKNKTISDTKNLIRNIVVDVTSGERDRQRRTSNDSILSNYIDDEIDVDEVDMYVSYKVAVTENFILLEWWENHQSSFPRLFELIKFIHSIPATSAPSERKFSLAGNIMNCLRASLDPSKIQDLLLLHSNENENM